MELFTEYFKKDHRLSRVDARVKILAALTLLLMGLSYKGFVFPLVLASLCFILSLTLKIPARVFLLRFSEPVFIIMMIMMIKFFFTGKDVIFSVDLFGLTIAGHKDGLMNGLIIAARIVGAVSVVALLGFATPFTELIAGLSWFRVPKGFIEVLMFAYRYIFVLLEEAMVIYHAQKNRLGYSSIRRGLSSFGTLTGSLILKAFEHSQNTTVAMIQRGYDGTIPLLTHKPFKKSEIAVSVLFLSVMGVIWNI